MTSSQTQVRELFSLPKKEVIFDDFGCAFKSGILHTGRMYLTENYICFYSSILGITQKVIIPLNDVTQVSKAKSLGMIRAIKIYSQIQAGKSKTYKFQSFSDCTKTFKIIQKLWSNVSPHAKEVNATSEEDNDNDTIDEYQNQQQLSILSGLNQSRGTEVAQVQGNVKANEALNSSGVQQNKSFDIGQAGANLNASVNSQSVLGLDNNINNADKGLGNQNRISINLGNVNNNIILQDHADDLSAINSSSGVNDIQDRDGRTFSAKINGIAGANNDIKDGSNVNRKQTEEVKQNGIMVEKAQGLAEINERSKSGRDQNKPDGVTGSSYEFITKDELERLLDPYPIPENYLEMDKVCLAMSVNEFFNQFAVHSGPHSFEKFYFERGEQKISTQEWKIPEPAEEYDSKPVIQSSQISVEIQIKDNPFVKVSPTTKYFKLIEKSDCKLHFKILSKCSGVPYCDTFAIEEDFLALAPQPGANVCVVRLLAQTIFYKSTIFKSKILSSSQKGCKDVWAEWVEWVKKRGVVFKEKKPPQAQNKLKHGIEKSSKLFEKKSNDEQSTDQNKQEQLSQQTFKAKMLKAYEQAKLYTFEYRIEIVLVFIIMLLGQIMSKLNRLDEQVGRMQNLQLEFMEAIIKNMSQQAVQLGNIGVQNGFQGVDNNSFQNSSSNTQNNSFNLD
eukprot:403358890